MKTTSQTAYVVGHVWMVGSMALPFGTVDWLRAVMLLNSVGWLVYAHWLQRKGR